MEALGRAVAATRAGQPARAARIVGAALAGQAAEPRRPVAGPWLDPEAEVVEPAARRRLGEVLRALRQGRRVAPAPEVPDGAAFLARRYACAAGARDYRLYVPASGRRGRLRGLVVMLHGCRQNPEDFATGTGMNALAEAHRLLVAYPGQTAVHNAHGCWNWFRPRDQRRGAGEPAIIAGMARGAGGGVRHRPPRGLRGRALGRRRHGGGARRGLPGCLRGDRRAFRAAGRGGERRRHGAGRHARRSRRTGAGRERARATDDRLPRHRRRDRAAAQRRADRGRVRRRTRGARRRPAGAATAGACSAAGAASSGRSKGRGTPGRAASRPDPTPTRTARTHRRRWCGSS